MLYPIKCKPVYREKIWGGNKFYTVLHREECREMTQCGESWEISGFDEEPSVVSNGFLAGNTLNELVEIYMGDLVGEKVFRKYGNAFPLLVKFIDAREDLSVQVHPDDAMAERLGEFNGKTEMWHVIQADDGARINVGFNRRLNRDELQRILEEERLEPVLDFHPAHAGSTFYIPAGTVHAIGGGVLLAEIQQLSDVTYRLYDYNRRDAEGNLRELHTEEALAAIDYSGGNGGDVRYIPQKNSSVELVNSPYFVTRYIDFDRPVEKIYVPMDSFVLYICVAGCAEIRWNGGESETICIGETLLVPACVEEAVLVPVGSCRLLEVYMP
ncbi:MAG: class I mannose-6-phosphate isomerase [Bacteroidales bacterium]|nr:class I mannose-6-phosphate isomerase [Bacteroidales bacterium]